MRLLYILLFLLVHCIVQCQSLTSKTWIKIKAERKDGSRIVQRFYSENSKLEYQFITNDTVLVSDYLIPDEKFSYSIENNKLNIGKLQHYIIETITDTSLVLVEVSDKDLNDDKLNRYYFISQDKYFEWLNNRNLINYINDSVVAANQYVMPRYDGNILKYLNDNINELFDKAYVTGSFLISPSGNISEVVITETKSVSDKFIDKFTRIFFKYIWQMDSACF